MAKATKLLRDIGFDTIAQHEADLTAYALTRLRDIPGLTIYGDTDPAHAKGRSGVIPFTMQQAPSNLVAAILGFEWGIGVRSGCFCAHPYVMTLLALDPLRLRNRILHNRRDLAPGLVRISFGLYNTTAEIDVLAKALTSIAEGRHSAYIADHRTGQYIPVNMKENFSDYFAL